jgi:hypothetical protein
MGLILDFNNWLEFKEIRPEKRKLTKKSKNYKLINTSKSKTRMK